MKPPRLIPIFFFEKETSDSFFCEISSRLNHFKANPLHILNLTAVPTCRYSFASQRFRDNLQFCDLLKSVFKEIILFLLDVLSVIGRFQKNSLLNASDAFNFLFPTLQITILLVLMVTCGCTIGGVARRSASSSKLDLLPRKGCQLVS